MARNAVKPIPSVEYGYKIGVKLLFLAAVLGGASLGKQEGSKRGREE